MIFRYCLFFVFFFVLGMISCVEAHPKNAIVLSLDGVSRKTFYALLQKERLPHIQAIIRSGNYRNMDGIDPVSYPKSVAALIGVQSPELHETMVSRKDIHSELFWSAWQTESELVLPEVATGFLHVNPVEIRSRVAIAEHLKTACDTLEEPFLLVANFPQPDAIGTQLREGSEKYSMVLEALDRSIGEVHRHLEKRGVAADVLWVFITTHGFMANSQQPTHEVWVASSLKVKVKGDLTEVLPSVWGVLTDTVSLNKLF